jgi:hypothetical protein
MIIENLCPVCGYEMEAPPKNYRICPSCGTEFGLHDANASIEELREVWLDTGPRWWSKSDPQPQNWDPIMQLEQVGIPAKRSVVRVEKMELTGTASFSTSEISGSHDWAALSSRGH